MKENPYLSANTVCVWGLGVSGLSAVRYLLKLGKRVVGVNQGEPKSWAHAEELGKLSASYPGELVLYQQGDPKAYQGIELVLLSPGIPREHRDLLYFHQKEIPLINDLEIAVLQWYQRGGGPIMAITGSNGKTTTATLCAHLLNHLGLRVFLGGNIGTPLCEALMADELNYDCAVLELSSFQLESLNLFYAKARGITNLSFTHGERYRGMLEYTTAKLRLAQNLREGDLMLVPQLSTLSDPTAHKLVQSCMEKHKQVKGIVYDEAELSEIYDMDHFPLLGQHNRENLSLATRLILHCFPELKASLRKALQGVRSPEHRLEPLAARGNRLVVNDSKSTNWAATRTAVTALAQRGPLQLILGGRPRGKNDQLAAHSSWLKGHVCEIFFYGEVGRELMSEAEGLFERVALHYGERLEDLFLLNELVNSEAPLLFSPGFPSFDLYQNFEKRGQHFKELVRAHLL